MKTVQIVGSILLSAGVCLLLLLLHNRENNRLNSRNTANQQMQKPYSIAGFSLEPPPEKKEETEVITKSLRFRGVAAQKQVVVDNIDGFIAVTGFDGDEVQLVVKKTMRAESAEALQEAKAKVQLELHAESDTVEIIAQTPGRQNNRGSSSERWNWGSWRYGKEYQVRFDIELRIPRRCNLAARTVNNGDIQVQNVQGVFHIENVNGGIQLTNIGGNGRAYTINGGVTATFEQPPTGAWYIGSLNGKVDALFPKNLSANLRFKTFNGNAYTDFEVTPIQSDTLITENHKGKRVYKNNQFYAVRVGNGGPELSFDAFNGSITIRKREQ